MKYFYYAISIFFVFVFLVQAEEGKAALSVNGYEWSNYSEFQKTAFIFGWLMCGKQAYNNTPIDLNKWDEAMKHDQLVLKYYQNAGVLISDVTVGQIIESINEIYDDARTKSMDITDIMPLVSGRLTQGWTKSNLDEVIAINIRLNQCQSRETAQGSGPLKECSSLRKLKMDYLKKISNK